MVTAVLAGCGGSDQTEGTASTSRPTSTTGGPSGATTASAGSAPTGSPSVKPGTGINTRLTLSDSFARLGESVDFEAEFVASTPSDSSRFTRRTEGVATLAVELPDALAGTGSSTLLNGSVAASGAGSGLAQVGVEVTRSGRPQAVRLTIFVEADLGYVAVGDANESATRRTLADGLLEAGVIDETGHAERVAAIAGGTG